MRKIYLLPLLIAVLVSGCRGGQSVVNRFYLLEYPANQTFIEADTLQSISSSLEVAMVYVHPAYSSHQIAIREDSHQLRYFNFNEWATRPANSLTAILDDFFHFNPLFERVVERQTPKEADFTLNTSVFNLEVVKERNRYQARLHLEYMLIDNQTGELVFSHVADQSRQLEKRNLNLFARAINEMFLETLKDFAGEIVENGMEASARGTY